MRVLLSNDDGYDAPGLEVLERLAATIADEVWVVAPADEQSGTGRSLTLTRPVRVSRFAERRFAVSGTPTDAVMMALAELMPEPPDLILSGVNRGANLGEDVLYSGTVAAAMEGALAGIRSIALSQRYGDGAADATFAAAEAWGTRVLRAIMDLPQAPRTMLNVNFPQVTPDAVQGIRVARQGIRDYGRAHWEKRTDLRGGDYYWLGFDRLSHLAYADTDLSLCEQGWVTVTPLSLDLTHDPAIGMLEQAIRDA